MSRLGIKSPSRAQTVVDNLYRDVERRIAASPPGLCPVDMSLAFLHLCHAQSCGKCVPCRIGLGQLSKLIATVLDGTGLTWSMVWICGLCAVIALAVGLFVFRRQQDKFVLHI